VSAVLRIPLGEGRWEGNFIKFIKCHCNTKKTKWLTLNRVIISSSQRRRKRDYCEMTVRGDNWSSLVTGGQTHSCPISGVYKQVSSHKHLNPYTNTSQQDPTRQTAKRSKVCRSEGVALSIATGKKMEHFLCLTTQSQTYRDGSCQPITLNRHCQLPNVS
jgi:hypothetical protein